MEQRDVIEILKDLIQVNIDIIHTGNRALDEISDKIVRSRLAEFQTCHQEHIIDLSDEIRSLGGQPPELSKDFKGYVIEAFAVLQTAAGMKGVLKALKTAEEITNRAYEKVIPKEIPADLKATIRKQFSDEKIHLDYINNNLRAL